MHCFRIYSDRFKTAPLVHGLFELGLLALGLFALGLFALGMIALSNTTAVLAQTAPSSALQPIHPGQPIQLSFKAKINGAVFECGQTYVGVGGTSATVTPSDFRLYVSAVELLSGTGQWEALSFEQDGLWQIANAALLDFENGSGPCRNGNAGINTLVRGRLPSGSYTALRFQLGLPFALNHGDPTVAAPPLSTTAMFWNWQGGYKFLKFDLSNPGFSFHLGSTACASSSRTQSPSSCANPNLVNIVFERFDPRKDSVVVDIGKLLSTADVTKNTPNTSPGCMSFANDPDCRPIMKALGLAYDGAAGAPQSLFYRE